MRKISDWERRFREDIEKIDESKRQMAGALLPLIPDREDWNEFLGLMKTFWQRALDDFPCCLLALYGGLAFYEYDAGSFWPQFQRAIETKGLSSTERGDINRAFEKAARKYDLKIRRRQIRRRPSSTDYVGSTVHHIGVPLSLWDDFLEICEWALWQEDWTHLSDEEWSEAAIKRSGSRARLKNFLLDNRETASDFIKEMHAARKRLTENQHLTISDLQQASLLRQEYFDEVPETAEFLRPQDPDSLIQDRVRLAWDDNQARIYLQLPAVSNDKLPATWKIGTLTQEAASTPDILKLNAKAFTDQITLSLESRQQNESQRLRGIAPWALFDREWKRFVNPNGAHFPVHHYTLISRDPLDNILRSGFDEEEDLINDRYELEDGTTCYITRLWPIGDRARLSFTYAGTIQELNFRPPTTPKETEAEEERLESSSEKIQIHLKTYDHRVLDQSVKEIVETVKRTGGRVADPISLPTHIERFTTTHECLLNIFDPTQLTTDALRELERDPGVNAEIKLQFGQKESRY